MFRSTTALIALAVIASILMVAAPVLGTTWDFSTDWSAVNTTAGVWTVGDGSITWSPSQGFWQYNTKFAGQVAAFDSWGMDNNYVLGECIKNTGAAGLSDYGAIYDAGEVGLFQGCPNVWGTAKHVSTVRWTAPADYAAITVHAKFSQLFAPTAGQPNGNTADVKVMYNIPVVNNNATLFSDTISGFRGTPPGYADAVGTHNTTTLDTVLMSVTSGTVIDFRVAEPEGVHSDTNQTGISATITEVIVAPGIISGTVKSGIGAPVAGVRISVDGNTLFADTGADGTYSLAIPAGVYNLTATKNNYAVGHRTGVNVTSGGTTSGQDFSLAFYGLAGKLTTTFDSGVTAPVGGATVIVSGSDAPYVILTDSAGYYGVVPAQGTYAIDVVIPGYSGGSVSGVSFVPGSSTIQNLSVHHEKTWDFAVDFSTTNNPNNQWSYGWLANQANDFHAYDAISIGYGPRFPTSIPTWYAAGQGDFKGGIGKFTDSGYGDPYYPDPNNPSAVPFPYFWYEANMGNMYNRGGGEACIRWKSPDARIIKLTVQVTAQCPDQGIDTDHYNEIHSYGQFKVKKNGVDMFVDHVQGFYGRSVNNYTDSIGPKRDMNFQTTLPVNAGDTIDLAQWYKWAWPYPLFGVWETVEEGHGDLVTTIAQIKGKVDGTTVFMTTPIALICDTTNFTDGSFYVQSDDRAQTLKLINDGTLPQVVSGYQGGPYYKIEFTGTVDTVGGQKVVRVKSINNTVPLSAPVAPLGISGKSIAAAPMGAFSNKLVRVWGKITTLVLNTDPTSKAQWKWEYAMITDGSQTVKIPMHNTNYWITEADATGGLLEGQFIEVTGIAVQNGSETLVYPRSGYDFNNYTLLGL